MVGGEMRRLQDQLDLRLAVTDDVTGDYEVYVKCREHRDGQRGNLAVYRDHLHCHVCGFHEARTIASLAYLLKVGLQEAIGLAPRYTAASLDGYREKAAQEARRDPLPASLARIYNGVLHSQRSHRVGWLKARGLSETVINAFQLGHDGLRFTIPVFDRENRLVALRYRRDEMYQDESTGAPKYSGIKGRNGQYLFPENWLAAGAGDYAVVCEGELDAVRVWQQNIPAVTITNGAGQVHKIPGLLREAFPNLPLRTLIIATDQDEAGAIAAKETVAAAQALGYRASRLTWNEGKDITEAAQLGAINLERFKEVADA